MCALVAGVQTCALPIFSPRPADADGRDRTVSPMNARFPRQVRVRARAEFDRAFQQGRRTASPLFSLHFVAGPPPARLGLAVSRKVDPRSEEHTSELQSLMRISYAVFCLKKTTKKTDIKQ